MAKSQKKNTKEETNTTEAPKADLKTFFIPDLGKSIEAESHIEALRIAHEMSGVDPKARICSGKYGCPCDDKNKS